MGRTQKTLSLCAALATQSATNERNMGKLSESSVGNRGVSSPMKEDMLKLPWRRQNSMYDLTGQKDEL